MTGRPPTEKKTPFGAITITTNFQVWRACNGKRTLNGAEYCNPEPGGKFSREREEPPLTWVRVSEGLLTACAVEGLRSSEAVWPRPNSSERLPADFDTCLAGGVEPKGGGTKSRRVSALRRGGVLVDDLSPLGGCMVTVRPNIGTPSTSARSDGQTGGCHSSNLAMGL
jgi:hypothetical protein